MSSLRKTITVNAALVATMFIFTVGFPKSQSRLIKEIETIETHAKSVNAANVVSSCSALCAVFLAWRAFTGYRRRCDQ